MNSSNPVLNRAFAKHGSQFIEQGETMTVRGTVNKTAALVAIASITAAYPWSLVASGQLSEAMPFIWGGSIAGFILAIMVAFKPHWAFWGAPAYAALEGLALGGISAFFEAQYPGIAFQALAGTFGTLAMMLFLYHNGIIKVTERFRTGVMAATGGIAIIYLLSMMLGFFGVSVPMIHDNGIVGIGFSLVVVGVAALNLVMDFDLIDRGAKAGSPKYMEWYGAFGLMVTLVWLYLEMLRLLSKIRGRD